MNRQDMFSTKKCLAVRVFRCFNPLPPFIPPYQLTVTHKFFLWCVTAGSKWYGCLQDRQKGQRCWKYQSSVASHAIRRSLPVCHQTYAPRILRVWQSRGRLGQRWVFSWGKCGSCGLERKGLSTHFPSPLGCNLPLGRAGSGASSSKVATQSHSVKRYNAGGDLWFCNRVCSTLVPDLRTLK